MSKEKVFSRREVNRTLALLPLLRSFNQRFTPEFEPSPLEPGNVVSDEQGRRYVIKEELDERSGNPILRRYLIANLNIWRARVGYSGKDTYVHSQDLSPIPIASVPRYETTLHWNETVKRHNKEGGIKFAFITGLGSDSEDRKNFDEVKASIKRVGFDEMDFLEFTYKIDPRSPLLGVPFNSRDSIQNPLRSLELMSRLLYLWKKQFPLEKIWLIGHSQGGWLAYELARRHPDAIAGVISLSGVIKGADVTPFPTPVEASGALVLYGEGGRFHIERGGNPSTFHEVEEEIKKLKKKGVVFVTLAATDDQVVRPEFALAEASHRKFGVEIELAFPMGSFPEADDARRAAGELEPYFSAEAFDLAKLIVGTHWAILKNQQVRDYIQLIILNTTPPPQPNRDEVEAMRLRILRRHLPENFMYEMLPHVAQTFSMTSFFDRNIGRGRFIVALKDPNPIRGRNDAVNWLRSLKLTEEQIEGFLITYKPETLIKRELIALMPIVTDEFEIKYLPTSDLFLVAIAKSPYGRSRAEAWLQERGVADYDSFVVTFTAYE